MGAKEFSYIGVGQVFVGGRPVGNVSTLTFAVQSETRELRDYQNPGGGTANSLDRITSVEVTMAMRDFVAENLALATNGAVSDVTSGSATDESHTATLDQLIRLDNMDPSSVVVTSDPSGTTYTEGTDYEVNAAGVVPLSGGSISDQDPILITYDYSARRVIEAIVASGQEFEMVFAGLNEAQSGKAVVIDAWRVKFSPAQSLDWIGDDFGELNLTGRVLKDASKTGSLSQYFRVSQVEA